MTHTVNHPPLDKPTGHVAAGGLAVTGVALLVAWAIFRAWLPWWASALTLACAAIAAIEAAVIARKTRCDE